MQTQEAILQKNERTIAKAKVLSDRLASILARPEVADPEWCWSYVKAMKNLSDFWNQQTDSVKV